MDNRKNCSKYKDESKRKLSVEKKKKLDKNKDCQEQKSLCDKCPKKKMKKIVKSCTHQDKLKCNNLLTKIKPPLSVREKYSNPQHVVCFNETTQNSRKHDGIIYTTVKGETKNLKPKKVNSWCKNFTEEKLLSNHLELNCDSVCSFDSIIDLEGLSLTTRDLKKIEKNRRIVHPPKENEEEKIEDIEKDKVEDKVEKIPNEDIVENDT